jgi:Ca-activated chloride channel family protein
VIYRIPGAKCRYGLPASAMLAAALFLASPPAAVAAPQAGEPPRVKIVTPRPDSDPAGVTALRALVRPGSSEQLRAEAFLDEWSLGVLEAPPYEWKLPRVRPLSSLRVDVVGGDGLAASDAVLLAGPESALFATASDAVALNLLATDHRGRFLRSLQRDEIILTDNGERQEILDFARTGVPLQVIVLFDRSYSMNGRMGGARRALASFLEQLEPEDRVKLICFNHRVVTASDFTADHHRLLELVDGYRPDGGTALHDALLLSLEHFERDDDVRIRPAILVFSDGWDQDSINGLGAAVESVRREGITLFAIGQGEALEDGSLRRGLERMAEATGGAAYFVRDPDRLAPTLSEVGSQMRAMYFLSYRPTTLAPGWHDLQVQIARERTHVRHKLGYQRER